MVKGRAYGIDFSDEERDGAIFTLHKVLSTILKLLAPITPFITEHLWKVLYSDESIHKEKHAAPGLDSSSSERGGFAQLTKEITEFNSKVWNEKKSKELSLKDSIAVPVPEILSAFSKDFTAMHHLE
jgi:valyl-tRNA synthetase